MVGHRAIEVARHKEVEATRAEAAEAATAGSLNVSAPSAADFAYRVVAGAEADQVGIVALPPVTEGQRR